MPLCQSIPIRFESGVPVSTNPHADTDAPITVLHSHDCMEISLCTDGCGILFLGTELRAYACGDCVVIPAGCPHRSQSAPGTTASWKTLYIHLAELRRLPSAYGMGFRQLPLMWLSAAAQAPAIAPMLDALTRELDTRQNHFQAAVTGELLVLFAALYRITPPEAQTPPQTFDRMESIAPALNHIAQHIGEPLDVPSLARLCSLSEPHFRRLFRAQMGQPPKQYVARMRAELACNMLADTRMSVLEIAYACGCESISAFNRAFRQHTGNSPLAWRKTARHSRSPQQPQPLR